MSRIPTLQICIPHGTIGPRKFFEFPENISPQKEKNCNNSDKRRNSEENSHHDLRNAIISVTILIVYKCIRLYRMM